MSEYVDSVRVEADEDGFHLIVETDQATYDFRVHPVAEELHRSVNDTIGAWLAEGEDARRLYEGMKLAGMLPEEER